MCPSFKTILVDATFRPNLKTVAINKRLGNDEKSKGRCVCNATMRISRDRVMLSTKKVSRSATGKGSTNIATSAIIPNGKNELTNFGEILPNPIVCSLSIHSPFSAVNILNANLLFYMPNNVVISARFRTHLI